MKTIFVEEIGTQVYYFKQDDENKFFGSYSKSKDMFDHMVNNNDMTVINASRTEITEAARKAFESGYSFTGMMYNADKNKITI